jgi:phosphate transport system permease protein
MIPRDEHALRWVRLMRLVTYLIVAVVAWVLIDVLVRGVGAISWEFLTEMPRKSGAEGGILPAIIGTVLLMTGTIIIALPMGMAGAIFLAEYAKEGRVTRWLRLGIITLAGVPSIVFGLFGLGLFVHFMGFGQSLVAGCFTLSCMILPTIIVSSEESLRAVPKGFREGAIALGATQWQTIYHNVLPYALPGMLTGSILGVARAAGETAPILLTAVAFFLPRLPSSVYDQVMALPYHLYVLATQHAELERVRPRAYGTAFVLLVLVLGFNLIAIVLRSRLRKKYRW